MPLPAGRLSSMSVFTFLKSQQGWIFICQWKSVQLTKGNDILQE